MLLFTHTGITLGAALAGSQFLHPANNPPSVAPGLNRLHHFMLSSLQRLSRIADIRFLLLGSVLPDLIDKPLAMGLFKISFGAGRALAHTLLFLIVIAAAGWLVYRRWKSTWLLAVGFGVLTHLVLDEMWLTPQTLFWPLYGVQFPKVPIEVFFPWVTGMLNGLVADPTELTLELLGLLILLWSGYVIWRSGKMERFIRTGRVA